MPVGSGKRER
ncbi:hypothetical protein HYQ46_013329 [Verticillium longisporum]|nr:hypothetical protein HYQ46_013329 [Verticillium longisporum]